MSNSKGMQTMWRTLALSVVGACLLAGCGEGSKPAKSSGTTTSGGTSTTVATSTAGPSKTVATTTTTATTTTVATSTAAPPEFVVAKGDKPSKFDVVKTDKPRILFLTQSVGFKHGSVTRGKSGELSPAEIAIKQLADTSGAFTVTCTQDAAADITKENLKNYDIVWFYTTSSQAQPAREAKPAEGKKPAVPAKAAVPAVGLPIPPDVLDYFFNDWLKQKGHGFIGSHSASDTFHEYKPYWDMIGGTFSGHPWNSKETVTIAVHDPDHPVAFGWGPEFQIQDEIYQYKNWQPEKVRVIMSLDMAKCKTKKPYQVPVAWVKQYGDGRVYYNNLGHNDATWQNKTFQDSLVHAISWVSGKTPGTAAPNPEVSKAEEAKAKAAAPEEPVKKPEVPMKKIEQAKNSEPAKKEEPVKEPAKKEEPAKKPEESPKKN